MSFFSQLYVLCFLISTSTNLQVYVQIVGYSQQTSYIEFPSTHSHQDPQSTLDICFISELNKI